MSEAIVAYLSSGRGLTAREVEEFRARGRVQRIEKWLDQSVKSLIWLGRALELPVDFDLAGLIRMAETHGSASLYEEPWLKKKQDGGPRIIIPPKPELMLLQKQINKLLLEMFRRPPNVFGYRGGSCLEVAERHASWPSTLKLDIRDAYFRVSAMQVRAAIVRDPFAPKSEQIGFSGSVAHWISRLCTCHPIPEIVKKHLTGLNHSFLPQGAPTSSILFDIVCECVDKRLSRLAERFGGMVSRYADNYYFSMKTSRISWKLVRIIVHDIEKLGFPVHKIRRVSHDELYRILGYNSFDGQVKNTRDFNRRLRGALYVLRTKLDRGLEWQRDWARVKGFMGFSVNIPPCLRKEFELCEQKIENM